MNATTRRILAAMHADGLLTSRAPFAPGTALQIVHQPKAPLHERYVAELEGRIVICASTEAHIRRWLTTMPGVSASPFVALRAPKE